LTGDKIENPIYHAPGKLEGKVNLSWDFLRIFQKPEGENSLSDRKIFK
jgi:hypothetical protein